MRPSQINALERIVLEALPGVEQQLIWFYRDLVGLRLLRPSTGDVLRFRSALVELRIVPREVPRVEPIRRRALVSVHCLAAAAEALEERGIPFTLLSGVTWTDRRVSVVDPGGNRVELKQEWRAGVLREAGGETSPAGAGPAGRDRKTKTRKKALTKLAGPAIVPFAPYRGGP